MFSPFDAILNRKNGMEGTALTCAPKNIALFLAWATIAANKALETAVCANSPSILCTFYPDELKPPINCN